MNYLLDTDHMTLVERGTPEGQILRARLLRLPGKSYGTTIVSYEEQMRGWLARIAQANTSERLIAAYTRLESHIEAFRGLPILPFDAKAAAEYEKLKKAYPRDGKQDLKIAAIALANDATLLTRNLQDFDKIPGLRAEDWSV